MPITPKQSESLLRDYNELPANHVLKDLKSTPVGLKRAEVRLRRLKYGSNEIASRQKMSFLRELLWRFANPLMLMLLMIALLSFFLGEKINAFIIVLMAGLGVILSYIQEHKAQINAEKLREMVGIHCHVIRNNKNLSVNIKDLVPGDIVGLSAGDMVPADLKLIVSKDLYINQSALNGESFPVAKSAEKISDQDKTIFDLTSILCMGSSIVSGTGQGVVINTGGRTYLGQLSKELLATEPETAFDAGIRKFTTMMIWLIFFLTAFIFVVNAFFKQDVILSLLFAVAVAVGLAPEMLPMIVTVNLSKGALNMAKKKVIIKRLDAIQNFGAMDILCTDKTGTLTINEITLVKHCDAQGKENEEILKSAYLNSYFQTGLNNLLDKAVLKHQKLNLKKYKKVDEIPFDFNRKIMSVVVRGDNREQLIAKGAPEEIIKRCTSYNLGGAEHKLTSVELLKLDGLYKDFSKQGFRVLGIAYKNITKAQRLFSKEDEANLTFFGFIAFLDPPKPSAKKAILDLNGLGIQLKIISGDNEYVTEKICTEVGLSSKGLLTGEQIENLTEQELVKAVETTTIFARVMPLQKERIIKALLQNKHVVGFLGDGINDAPALKAADVGISVDNAVDIAKETADIILLERSLLVLGNCVKEGRRTFANTLKYIKMGASSNFGNMFSMTGASIFLPFLPMLPAQILLNNFLYDISQIAIPTDEVDEDYIEKPRPWNIKFIKEFILYIGPVSSIFDFITFGVMLYVFKATPAMFQTGWFVESLFTQTLIIHVIRTNKIPFLQSRASKALIFTTLGVVAIGCLLPFSPLAGYFNFVPLPAKYFIILMGIATSYLILTEIVKRWFIRKFGYD